MGFLGQGNLLELLLDGWDAPKDKKHGWRAQGVGARAPLFPSSRLRLRGFKASYRHILENNDLQKILGQFEFV